MSADERSLRAFLLTVPALCARVSTCVVSFHAVLHACTSCTAVVFCAPVAAFLVLR